MYVAGVAAPSQLSVRGSHRHQVPPQPLLRRSSERSLFSADPSLQHATVVSPWLVQAPYFFKDLSSKVIEDQDLTQLLMFPNVIMTAHQAFFTQASGMRNLCYLGSSAVCLAPSVC